MTAPATLADASGLAETVERARALLDDGDVIAARMLASGAYDQARAAGAYAERFQAGDRLIAKARRLQGDALLIETRAKIRIADEYDFAQAAGLVRKPGQRGKAVKDDDRISTPTVEDLGLSKQDVLQMRRLRDAERGAPGLVERAIAARLAAGLEPSRANLRAAVGTASAPAAERGANLYETPGEAMRALLALERFLRKVYEPACGRGAILRPLEDAGHDVAISDLVDYGTATSHGEVQGVADFMATRRAEGGAGDGDDYDIVTNPPYGADLNRFVAHALKVHRPRKMALLLNLNFLCGFDDPDRCFAMDSCPPARVLVFTRRLPMMHRDGWDGNEAASRMNTAWFVWERDAGGGYAGPTVLTRVDWKDYVDAPALGPEDGMADAGLISPLAGEMPGRAVGGNVERVASGKRGFCEALSDWSDLNRLKARGDGLSDEERVRRDALASVVAADLAPIVDDDPQRETPPSVLPDISPSGGEIMPSSAAQPDAASAIEARIARENPSRPKRARKAAA